MERRQTTGGIDVGLYSVARELCEPIATLRQLALSAEWQTDSTAVQQRMVAVSDAALRQVEDVVRMAKLSDALFAMEPVAVRGVCADVVAEMAQALDVKFVVKCRNKQRLCVANRELLSSIIWHLCVNGARNSERGAKVELSVADLKAQRLRLRVRDYGPALPLPTARLVRDGKLDRLTDSELRLGGLGLVIVSRFAEFMAGEFGMVQHRDGLSLYVDLPVSGQLSLC